MQKVVEFKEVSFWTSQPNIRSLNQKIEELNRDGFNVVSVIPNTGFSGRVTSYTLFVETAN